MYIYVYKNKHISTCIIHATSFMKRHTRAGSSSYTFMNTQAQFNTYTKNTHAHTYVVDDFTTTNPAGSHHVTSNWLKAYAQWVSWSGQFIVDSVPVSHLRSLSGVRGRSNASGQKWERWQYETLLSSSRGSHNVKSSRQIRGKFETAPRGIGYGKKPHSPCIAFYTQCCFVNSVYLLPFVKEIKVCFLIYFSNTDKVYGDLLGSVVGGDSQTRSVPPQHSSSLTCPAVFSPK